MPKYLFLNIFTVDQFLYIFKIWISVCLSDFAYTSNQIGHNNFVEKSGMHACQAMWPFLKKNQVILCRIYVKIVEQQLGVIIWF